jgi:hypothetical protein
MRSLRWYLQKHLQKWGVSFGLGLLVVLGLGAAVQSQSAVTRGTIVQIAGGDGVFVQTRKARLNDVAQSGQQIRTEQASTQVEFNNRAIARLGPNSRLTVGGCGAQLQQGKALISGPVTSCTQTITAAVRGTTYTVEIKEDGQEVLEVLEGEVEVRRLRGDSQRQWQVRGGENCIVGLDRVDIRPLRAEEFERTLQGWAFKGFQQDDRKLERIQQVYARLYPGRRFPIRRGPQSVHRGHFSLAVRQKRPLLPFIIARVSWQGQRSGRLLPEQFVGDFRYPIDGRATFIRGLNPGDRLAVRLFDPQNNFLGYTEFVGLEEQAAVSVVVPDVPEAYGTLRTVVGEDANRDGQIDAGGPVFDFYTRVEPDAQRQNTAVRFLRNAEELNRDFFNVSGLPTPAMQVAYPDELLTGLLSPVTRPVRPFRSNLDANLVAVPGRVAPVVVNPDGRSTFEVTREVLRYRRAG